MLDPSGNEGDGGRGGGGLALGKRSSYFSLAPLGIQECAKNKLQLILSLALFMFLPVRNVERNRAISRGIVVLKMHN